MTVILFLILLTLPAVAQSPLGNITGLASDPSGAAIANAAVTLTHSESGVRRETRTNNAGNYGFPNLIPGTYKLAAQQQGFRNFETTEFRVDAYQTVRRDLRFEIASSATEITVDASAGLITTETPAISNRLSARQISELPTNLRSVYNNAGDSGLIFQMLPLAIPGVVQVGAGATWLVPGGTANSMRLKVDGIDANFGNFGTPDPVSQPSLESIDEFTANVFANKAEFGGLAAITTVTRAGTNKLHGALFWYPRNSAFDARQTFQPRKPFQNIHNFGGNIGGPVRKNATFAFFNFDTTRASRAYAFQPNVPTVAMRAGDFSAQTAAVRDAVTGQPYPGNRIPASAISPVAQRAQDQFFPLPNFGAANLTAANYRASFNGPEYHDIYELRLDHNWNSRHSTFGRYQHKKSDYDIPGVRGDLPPQSTGTSQNIRRSNIFTLGDTMSITPSLFNEFRGGAIILVSYSDAGLKGQPLLDKLGITGLPSRGNANGIPNIGIAGFASVSMRLLNPVNDGHYQLSDNLTWVRGRHTVKTGVEYVNWFVNRYFPVDPAAFGNFNFSGRFTNNAYADFLVGLPNTVTRLDPYPTGYFRWFDLAWYVQDDYKLTGKLTLNYGLRYEYNQPLTARDGNLYSFDIPSGAIVVPSEKSRAAFSPYFPAASYPIVTAGSLNLPESLRRADKNNFAPRMGFSYQPMARTVIRGGAGIYYNHYSGAVGGLLSAGPFSISTTSNNNIVNGQPLFTFARPFAAPGAPSALNVNAMTQNLRNAYTAQYTLSVEREITGSIAARVSYIGSRGVNQAYQRNINQPRVNTTPFSANKRPLPRYNNIVFADNGAYNSYNGLQVQVNKRFSSGLQFQSAWTWSKQLSEVDDTGNGDLNTSIEDAYDRRRDRADVQAIPRHEWRNQAFYELPLGSNRLLKGWQTNFLVNLSTGHFLNPTFAGADPGGIGATGGRPDAVRPVTYPEELGAWFDRTAFAALPNGAGRLGNAARNSIVGPGYVVANFGVSKTVPLEKYGSVQVSATFQNVLNHFNWGAPNTTVNNANGGIITSTHVFPAAGTARTTQLGLRWAF